MSLRRLALLSIAAVAMTPAAAAELYGARLQVALETPVGSHVDLPLAETLAKQSAGDVRMRRIEVVAPGAKTYVIDDEGRHELPDTGWRHFIADASVPDAPRYGLSISPDGREAIGMLFTTSGKYTVRGSWRSGALQLEAELRPKTDAEGDPIYFSCELDAHQGLDLTQDLGLPSRAEAHAVLDAAGVPKATLAASRSATVAIDTDTELLAQKFGGNTTNATNYLNALFVGMNLIYERDIDVTLLRGDTTLRTGSDPYSTTSASSTIDQLDEFGEEWFANQGAVNRAFAAQISGKSASNNSSAGVAWLIGANNMCTQKGTTFGGCPDGTCTAGHYSISRVFKFGGSTAADDVLVVAHELGHNFGVNHTHCTSAASGNQPVNTGTIDQCFNGESGSGCYGGATSCPAPQTINGVNSVTGTLMSYCHLSGIGGCDSFEVFHPRNVTNLDAVADANVTNGCFTTGGGGTISIADRTLGEATTPMNFTLTRSNSSGTASVVVSTAAGTATGGGTDYTNVTSQTVNFANGSTTATLNVTINNDAIDEIDETFVVNLTSPSAGYTISDAQATGTITDDDTSSVAINNPAAVTEGSSINFNVTLSTPNSRTVTVRADTANGTATSSGDYTARSNVTVTFTPGDVSETFTVSTTDDNLDEPDGETFSVNLSNVANAVIGDNSGTGTINDNEATPTISIADAPAQAEDNVNPLRYVVTLSGASQSTITVRADTANGSATAGSDYTARSNVTVTFPSGDVSENFDVNKNADATFEGDETVLVNLSNVSAGASILDGSASGTISNDDPGPVVSIADGSLTEPPSTTNMPFTISIPGAVGADVTVNFSTSPIDATPGSDYTAASGSATISTGNTTGTVNIPILHDTTSEFSEQFFVNITATTTSQIGDGQAVGTILDNDPGGDPVLRHSFE